MVVDVKVVTHTVPLPLHALWRPWSPVSLQECATCAAEQLHSRHSTNLHWRLNTSQLTSRLDGGVGEWVTKRPKNRQKWNCFHSPSTWKAKKCWSVHARPVVPCIMTYRRSRLKKNRRCYALVYKDILVQNTNKQTRREKAYPTTGLHNHTSCAGCSSAATNLHFDEEVLMKVAVCSPSTREWLFNWAWVKSQCLLALRYAAAHSWKKEEEDVFKSLWFQGLQRGIIM